MPSLYIVNAPARQPFCMNGPLTLLVQGTPNEIQDESIQRLFEDPTGRTTMRLYNASVQLQAPPSSARKVCRFLNRPGYWGMLPAISHVHQPSPLVPEVIAFEVRFGPVSACCQNRAFDFFDSRDRETVPFRSTGRRM